MMLIYTREVYKFVNASIQLLIQCLLAFCIGEIFAVSEQNKNKLNLANGSVQRRQSQGYGCYSHYTETFDVHTSKGRLFGQLS